MIGVLVVMVGIGVTRFYLVENAEIDRLSKTVDQKKTQLHHYQQIAADYDSLANRYQTLKTQVNKSAKLLVKAKNANQVYSALVSLSNDSAFTYMNFMTVDSINYNRFGLLTFTISGEGDYKNLNQFVDRLEYGRPLFKIREMNVKPSDESGALGSVTYNFKLESIYDRESIFQDYSKAPQKRLPAYTYNSFYPLIHNVRNNTDNLLNVEKSTLVSMGTNFVVMRNQKDQIQYINIGDPVYLGNLISINNNKNSATFKLNKGGIIKYITRVLK